MITSQGKMPLEYYFDKNYELEEQLRMKKKQDLLDQINAPKNMANYVFMKQKEQL
jgi:UTP-glucose-1-phosphate uridylyltransferase